jgi:hypothetical protein
MLANKLATDMLDLDEVEHGENHGMLRPYRKIVKSGWIVEDDGAVLLRRLLASCHGDRQHFTTVTAWENAVNGRGIPDMDVTEGPDRIARLMYRGAEYARAATAVARRSLPDETVLAYVYVTPSPIDPADRAGTVTFTSPGTGEIPYVSDVAAVDDCVLVSFSSDDAVSR